MSAGTQDAPANDAASSVLRGAGAAALGLLHGHLELLGIELQEQKARARNASMLVGRFGVQAHGVQGC